ncbi:VOC family protein [Solirubrobacter soli]|uniref:VOC family protein n=1 Tax=Solirubrobacter soli TaxID=363832 RepID=UPI0004205BEA|nr:VOC family protein [Solirubrobacter soli]
MEFTGLHHITMITGDAQQNAAFYGDLLGLRLVKKTVNFDQPQAYHLYFGDETGAPGSILTWFEFPGAAKGRAGAGSIHTLQLAVADEAALDFWEQRLAGCTTSREPGVLRFADYDGLKLELLISDLGNAPLVATHPDVPEEHAIQGLHGARAYAAFHSVEDTILTDLLGFTSEGGGEYVLNGSDRRFRFAYDAPTHNDHQGAGSVHHIAWASTDEDHLAWQERIAQAGGFVTDVRDRDYFKSIYFRVPSGVLFEIATLSPGFAVDEDADHLGEALKLPKQHEHLRAQLESTLRPVNNPRVLA